MLQLRQKCLACLPKLAAQSAIGREAAAPSVWSEALHQGLVLLKPPHHGAQADLRGRLGQQHAPSRAADGLHHADFRQVLHDLVDMIAWHAGPLRQDLGGQMAAGLFGKPHQQAQREIR